MFRYSLLLSIVLLLFGDIADSQTCLGGNCGGGGSGGASLTTTDQTLSGGANVDPTVNGNLGTKSSGTLTVDCGLVPLQYATNGGAFTLAAPAHDGSCSLLVTNNASAGAITFSGFSVGVSTGDSLDTTNGHTFMIGIRRINGVAGYSVQANQ